MSARGFAPSSATTRYTPDGGTGAVSPAQSAAHPAAELLARSLVDPARLAALHATGLLDAPAAAAFDRLTRLAARVLGVPAAAVSLVDADRHVFAGCVGVPEPWAAERRLPMSHSVCQHVVASGAPLVVEDAREHPLVRDNPAVGDLGVAAYAGMPLVTAAGQVLGSFCVIDAVPRRWTAAELDTLRDLAQSAVTELELRAANAGLAERTAQYRELLDHTNELACTTDAEGRLTFVNAAWQRALGYTAAEAAALAPAAMVAPEDRERYRLAARRLVAGEPVHDFEAELLARDGRRVVCRGWAVPRMAPGPDGRPVYAGTRAGYRDVTAEREAARVRAEAAAALRASEARARAVEARFRSALDASLDAFVVLESVRGADGRIADFAFAELNARAAALFDMPAEDYGGHTLCALYPVAVESGLFTRLAAVAARGRPWEGEFRPLDPRIAAEWLYLQAVPLPGGDGAGVVVTVRDVSARKRADLALAAGEARARAAEAELRALFAAMRDVVLVLDAEGRYVRVVPTAPDLLYRPPAEFVGKTVHDLLPADVAAQAHDTVREALATGRARQVEYALTLPQHPAAPTWFSATASPLSATQVLWVARDVTAQRRAAEFKDQLIATASHELRTPLTAIKGALDLLDGAAGAGGRPERERYLLGVARRNAQRLVRLVGDLLDTDRLEAGQLPLAPERADVAALVGLAWDALLPLADQAGVRLDADWAAVGRRAADRPADAGPGPLLVWADAERVQQVLVNLVANAVKFSPPGATVTLGAAREPAAAEGGPPMVRISVRDEGRGIPADQLEAVFERFVQVERGDAREKGGAGLGLAICRAIVGQHGGRIWAESAGVGRGSTFHFTLPVTA